MKKKFILFSMFLAAYALQSIAQSNPLPLKPGITINRLMTVRNGAVRMERDPISNNLFYILTGGDIYKVIQPAAGAAYDTLIATVSQHGVQYVQGMVFHDSTWYVSGNNNSNTPLTYGLIVRGKLQANGTRVWDTLMHTNNYQTNGSFDLLFTGMTVSPAGDSIFICSGARGDHGEIGTRNGLYPGLRNTPLTTNIYGLPTHNPNIITLANDSALLAASGYVYARGIRNTFDMEFDQNGHLFGVEHSGDRDHHDEMNWIRKGRHYGFPWKMGDTDNPQQFSWFNPAADMLINHNSKTWRFGVWTNDTLFPLPPPGLNFEIPIQNFGPDCDKYRDSLGSVHDASDEGISIGSFTSHRSPLGLVFDNDNILGPLYRGHGFMLSLTQGYDSTGSPPPPDSTHIGPFVDPSQDLVDLKLVFDSTLNNFRLNAARIIADFINPIDAEIDSNKIYVLENGSAGVSGLYVVHMPVETYPCAVFLSTQIFNPCNPDSNRIIVHPFGALPDSIAWQDSTGTIFHFEAGLMGNDTMLDLASGHYTVYTTDGGACGSDTLNINVPFGFTLVIDSVHHTNCIGCNDGEIFYHGDYGNPPYVPNISTTSLSAGNYYFCITDMNGCVSCDSAQVLEDPSLVSSINRGNDILLFPNPVNEHATLIYKGKGSIKIKITDIKGAEEKVAITKISGEQSYSIDCSKLSAGTYFIEVITENNNILRKLIVKN